MTKASIALPGYQIAQQIYTGSRTSVYRGLRECDRTPVILKIFTSECPTVSELVQFRHQYNAIKDLDLPGIVKPYSLETYRNRFVLVMEDFGGVSLRTYYGSNQTLAAGETQTTSQKIGELIKIAIEIVKILDELHSRQIIHGCISLWRMCQKRDQMKKLVKSLNKDEANNMTPSDQQQLKSHLKAVAEILYRNTDPTELKSCESREKSLDQKMLEEVGPELCNFFFHQYQELKQESPEK